MNADYRPSRTGLEEHARVNATFDEAVDAFGIFASLAEFERELIAERTRVGLAVVVSVSAPASTREEPAPRDRSSSTTATTPASSSATC